MKIYYSKKQTIGDVTVEIKIDDKVDHSYEVTDQAFARLKRFVDEKLEAELLEYKLKIKHCYEENPLPRPVF
jgi:hypothetical protein